MDITDITPRAGTSERLYIQRPDLDRLDMQPLGMHRRDLDLLDLRRPDMQRLDMDRLDMQRLDMLDGRHTRRCQELKNRLPHRNIFQQRTAEACTCQHTAGIRANIRSSNELAVSFQ